VGRRRPALSDAEPFVESSPTGCVLSDITCLDGCRLSFGLASPNPQ
jgi:hypothetical protein